MSFLNKKKKLQPLLIVIENVAEPYFCQANRLHNSAQCHHIHFHFHQGTP
jgi:hypothetical protein